ncbi:MAG: MFS transporter [Bacteroidales bacterium]|nr:MFS transporter [Bacteroidales bacterium]
MSATISLIHVPSSIKKRNFEPMTKQAFIKDKQYYKFCAYGFLKNLRLFEPFLILFFLEAGLSFLEIGLLYSVREIMRNLLEMPAGILADSLGRRRTMISSFVFYIISFITFYYSHSYHFFMTAMVFYALGDAFRTGTHKAMIFDYLKIKGWHDQKVHYYGHTRSWSQLGSASSALIAGALVFFSGEFRLIFIFSTIPYVLDLINIATYPKALDGNRAKLSKKELLQSFWVVMKDFWESFSRMKTLKALVNLSMHSGFYRSIKDYLQEFIKVMALSLPLMLAYTENQRAAVLVGIVYFFIFLLSSRASRYSGKFANKFKHLSTPLNFSMLLSLCFGVLSGLFYANGYTGVSILFFVGVFLIQNLRMPIGISYVTEIINKDILATVLSAESQTHSIIAAVLAPLIGYLADAYGLGYALAGVSGLLLILLPFVWLGRGK